VCRSIVQLRGEERPEEAALEAAARQFVRKISGFRQPSKANQEVFDQAIEEIAAASRHLLDHLVVRTPA
jgi:hypothetical protein